MNEYTVRIVPSEITIVAESSERAQEIAEDIFYSDARTRLSHGLTIDGFEVDDRGPSDREETEV